MRDFRRAQRTARKRPILRPEKLEELQQMLSAVLGKVTWSLAWQ